MLKPVYALYYTVPVLKGLEGLNLYRSEKGMRGIWWQVLAIFRKEMYGVVTGVDVAAREYRDLEQGLTKQRAK
jgi:hypothetical protein